MQKCEKKYDKIPCRSIGEVRRTTANRRGLEHDVTLTKIVRKTIPIRKFLVDAKVT